MIAEGLAGPAGHLRLGPMNFGPLLMRRPNALGLPSLM